MLEPEEVNEGGSLLDYVFSSRGQGDELMASDPQVELDQEPEHPLFQHLGLYDYQKEQWQGPLVANLGRLLMTPMFVKGYLDNYPQSEAEIKQYIVPPLLQEDKEDLDDIVDSYVSDAVAVIEDDSSRRELLQEAGELAEKFTRFEPRFPACNSTAAYETFGMFHLLPANDERDEVTATTPGVILPTERDPNQYPDSLDVLKTNRIRPAYFQILADRVKSGKPVSYFAAQEGTAETLKSYKEHYAAGKGQDYYQQAKEFLKEFLDLGDTFELFLGPKKEDMRHATLVGDAGVVFSGRGSERHIVHNLSDLNSPEARAEADHYHQIFEEQIKNSQKVESADVLDQLVAESS